ncbi:hypothetical protein GOV13_05190 [Candidatus Pacearchaeota archaeon]|nr:hypothetical protein [Candidatus Pacearchaeota archaeon]
MFLLVAIVLGHLVYVEDNDIVESITIMGALVLSSITIAAQKLSAKAAGKILVG